MNTVSEAVKSTVRANRDYHCSILEDAVRVSMDGVNPFQQWLGESLRDLGAAVTEFTVSTDELLNQPAYRRTLDRAPETLRGGKNVVANFPTDSPTDHSLLFFAHADKNPATYDYSEDGISIRPDLDRFVGPGIADDISGLAAIRSAIEVAQQLQGEDFGVTVASVLGKQFGVLGTYGLMQRHDPTDAAVYVHPAESGGGLREVKVGSNGMAEFIIEIEGRSPTTTETHHPLFIDTAVNPISIAADIDRQLQRWGDEQSEMHRFEPLESLTGRSFGVLSSRIDAGETTETYEVPNSCQLRGIVGFAPTVTLDAVQTSFQAQIQTLVDERDELSDEMISLAWGDCIAEASALDPNSSFLATVSDAIDRHTNSAPTPYYGHSASDIRYPMQYWDAPTIGFGPNAGDMGTASEWVEAEQYYQTIEILSTLLIESDRLSTA